MVVKDKVLLACAPRLAKFLSFPLPKTLRALIKPFLSGCSANPEVFRACDTGHAEPCLHTGGLGLGCEKCAHTGGEPQLAWGKAPAGNCNEEENATATPFRYSPFCFFLLMWPKGTAICTAVICAGMHHDPKQKVTVAKQYLSPLIHQPGVLKTVLACLKFPAVTAHKFADRGILSICMQ